MNLKHIPKRLDSKTSSLRITVPENLDLALEGLIRKVLREQPRTDDIYSFAANYFETLLKIRDKAGASYTAGQSCLLHNDEDSHEMIKLAGTFKKPEKFRKTNEELMRNGTKKDLKRPKPKRTVKDEKIVKQKPLDLIKKSTENRLEVGKTSLSGRKTETIEEKVEIEGEFLTSDPIKELVEKELIMEAKGNQKEAAADMLEFPKKENKQEELKADDKVEIKELILEENEEKPSERNIEEETTEIAEIKEVPVNSEEKNQAEAVNIATESQYPTTEQEQPKHTEKKEESKLTSEEVPAKEVELPETPKQEEKIQIDKETKATDENIAEHSIENYSSVTNSPDIKKNEEKVEELKIKNEKGKEILSKVDTAKDEQENNSRDASKGDEIAENKELVKSEGKYENERVKLEIEEKPVNVENKTIKQNEEFEGDEQNQKAESSKVDDTKPTEGTKLEQEIPQTQTNPDTKTPETTQIEVTSKQDNSNETASEMDDRNTSTNEQKLKEEPKPAKNQTEEALIDNQKEERKDETETQKPEHIQAEDKKTELDDLQGVVEKAESDREEEITNQELCMVVDIKSIAKEDTGNEKQVEKDESGNEKEKTQTEEDETTQEKLSTVIDGPKEDTEDEKQIEKIENEIEEEKEINPGVLEGVESAPKDEKKEETTPEELCMVVDVKNMMKEPNGNKPNETMEAEKTEKNAQEESSTVEDVKNIPKETTETDTKATIEDLEDRRIPDELCTVVDVLNLPKEDEIDENTTEKPGIEILEDSTQTIKDKTNSKVVNAAKENTKNENKAEAVETELPDIVEPEETLNPDVFQPPEEVLIKTIQTHYYDTLKVPEAVTKEYIVHNVTTPQINTLAVANSLQQNYKQIIDENMKVPPPIGFIESTNGLSRTEKQMQIDTADLQEIIRDVPQISDSDDLLDLTTPTSDYSLNLSEISWQTINGMFLDSERKYSSLEIEEVRHTTSKSEGQNRQEVEEVFFKSVIPTGVNAVPVPPRDMEEINSEQVNSESVKQKKDKKSQDESEGSRSDDSDVPFISVEVKTVVETQVLDAEEETDCEIHPGVEVTVETTIDIQDDVRIPQSEPNSTEEENKITNEKSQEIIDLKPSLEKLQSTSQEHQQKESSSTEQTTVKESSSVESSSTISSAATEIKRTDLAKRNFSSTRSLLSTQSLDLGKKNPLLKTRSLSTFRHGVTDFEVWNTIEKELEEAATKIQSKFRGYKTRKKLQRENAVQITTEESSPSTTPAEVEVKEEGQQSTGEFHDSIVLAEHPR